MYIAACLHAYCICVCAHVWEYAAPCRKADRDTRRVYVHGVPELRILRAARLSSDKIVSDVRHSSILHPRLHARQADLAESQAQLTVFGFRFEGIVTERKLTCLKAIRN